MLFEEDYLVQFRRALQAEISKNCETMGTILLERDAYIHLVGQNVGLQRAIELIKETADGLRGDDDEG